MRVRVRRDVGDPVRRRLHGADQPRRQDLVYGAPGLRHDDLELVHGQVN